MLRRADRSSDGRRTLILAWLVLAAITCGASIEALADPVYYPPTRAGWQGQILDERDTAPYLAFHKTKMYERVYERLGKMEGRQTPNQDAYDAIFYDLDLNLNPATSTLTGSVDARVKVVAGPLTTLDLDLDNLMTVSSVTSGGTPATYSHTADLLTVNLDRPYATDELIEVTVSYSGNPEPGGAFGWDAHNGQPMIWTLSEPFGARTWWPCKDWSHDKADSVWIRVVTPTGLITASNGSLVEATDNGAQAITRWREKHPIATYLVSLAIHPFTVYSDYFHHSPTDSMEIKFFIFPDHVAEAMPTNALVKDMLAAYTEVYGPYPFLDEKYGHAEFPWGGGMEHQTCTSLGVFIEYITAHELAHQWWGDMVTCKDFHHIWINEGLATFSEAIWAEANGGMEAYHQDLSYNQFFGPGTIYVPDLSDWGRIFDHNLTYNKASWVVHMLRHVLGDEDFFASLAALRAQYGYDSVTTEEFRDVCEGVSGQDLDYFFQQWIYGEYYPQYRFDYSVDPVQGGFDIVLDLYQTQSWQIFTMPVDVTVTTASGEQTFVVMNTQAAQTFTLQVVEEPLSVKIDKDNWILRTVQEPVVNPPLDRSVLLVNGVDWGAYGAEILTAYENRAFWGDYTIDFWDHFNEPPTGYPSTLPEPLGHGPVPADVMGHYRNIVWVGNNYGGDLASWLNSPIQSYLEAGGNLLLLARNGDQFITESLRQYLGITWASGSSLLDCIATYPGLTNIARIGTQSAVSVFNQTLSQPDARIIYKADAGYSVDPGIGVWREPVGGGRYRHIGAQFVFLSGRPYRWNHANLKTNVMYILRNFFREPMLPAEVEGEAAPAVAFGLEAARPNPSSGMATLRYTIPRAGDVTLDLLDIGGRRVRRLIEGAALPGPQTAVWDGLDAQGHPVPSGTYWVVLRSEEERATRKVTILR
ncbi:MAG: hypothetical protein FJY88_08110 [Candidatus Eisenbacteria bacterium]|nr:hypothetical protein [Candidatus Eisenbacteria bacterium]